MKYIAPLLTVLFIGLKLTGVIDWSWVMVVSPIWMPLVVVMVLYSILFFWQYYIERKRKKND